MSDIPNQRVLWNDLHGKGKLEEWRNKPNVFAQTVSQKVHTGRRLLELGCGTGADAALFASKGVHVVATDFSEAVIDENNRHPIEGVKYQVLDIAQPYSYEDGAFEYVYAHLSLHYYLDKQTRDIFREIHRILKPGGQLFFKCKSIHDRTYGMGREIEPNMFDAAGHIRHLFSIEYTKSLLEGLFIAEKLEESVHVYAGHESNFIECEAIKV